ncbi:MAG: hypothetical protein CMJ46_04945 [Planctomyces sp.]|nr:hypothetical protein [Planctomyces sp.]
MKIEIDAEQLQKAIARYRAERLPGERYSLTERVAREVVTETIDLSPVETGKSRAGWLASLSRLSGVFASTGGDEGEPSGELQRSKAKDRSEIRVTNEVEYINYLEYGTRNVPAFGMVRRALMRVTDRLRRRG